jgi:hypothetical protein
MITKVLSNFFCVQPSVLKGLCHVEGLAKMITVIFVCALMGFKIFYSLLLRY